MFWPPLIERELRVALRKKQPARRRMRVALRCVAGAFVFLLLGTAFGTGKPGHWLHRLLCVAGFYLVIRVPPLVAGVFAEERRERTLGLLFLSGLSAAEVFASKVLSSALVAGTELLVIFPLLALPFLTGGVSFDLYIATVFTLPALLVFVLAVTLLASTLTDNDGAVVVLAAALGLALCLVPLAVHYAQVHFAPLRPTSGWLRLSPAYAPFLVLNGRAPSALIWPNLGFTLLWSGLCLAGAAAAVKRFWREQGEGPNWGAPWREQWRRWVHGSAARRQHLAARWLDVNPCVWLAARDRQPAVLAWGVAAGICAIGLLCWAVWGAQWPSAASLLLTALLLNLALRWIIVHTAAREMAGGRRDGAYEMLLTTRLLPGDIVWGTLEAMSRHFLILGRCVLALNGIMMLGGLATRSWNGRALFVYFVTWAWLFWWVWGQNRQRRLGSMPGWAVGQNWPAWNQRRRWRLALPAMWAALNCGRPILAVWRSSGLSGMVCYLCFWSTTLCFGRPSGLGGFPTGSVHEFHLFAFVAVGLVLALLTSFMGGVPDRVEKRLILEFREIAHEPMPDADDPRLKKWNFFERLGA